MVVIYVGLLLFGGVLIAASLFGAGGHDADVHAGGGDGGADHGGDGHTPGAQAWLSLFSLRFWSFAAAFFGLTGLVLNALGAGRGLLVPLVSGGVGAGAGLVASSVFRAISRDTVGQVASAAALVGREGRLLLPVDRAQRGKVRLAQPAGGHLDLLAETSDDDALAVGTDVLIVEMRGNVAVVARVPGTTPAAPGS